MVNYRTIGTNIDCFARTMEDGRFQVNVTVEDSWIYENPTSSVTPSAAGEPVIRSFRSANTLVMRDGQTRQFTANVTDQFGNAVASPTINWSIDAGGDGSIDSNGSSSDLCTFP